DDTGEDVLPFGLDRHAAQAIDQHAHDERTDHRSDDRAAAAHQGGAADDHGRDGLQLVAGASGGLGGAETGGQQQTGDADEDTGEDVLPFGLDRHAAQAIDQHAHDERTDHRSDDRAAAAHQGGAADDHGRDGLQLVAGASGGLGGAETGGQQHTGDADEDTG